MADTPMMGQDTPCKVISLTNGLHRQGRAGVASATPGMKLYFLWHEPTRLYYSECYVSQVYAIKKAMKTTGPRSMSDVAQSWVSEAKYCHHSWKTED